MDAQRCLRVYRTIKCDQLLYNVRVPALLFAKACGAISVYGQDLVLLRSLRSNFACRIVESLISEVYRQRSERSDLDLLEATQLELPVYTGCHSVDEEAVWESEDDKKIGWLEGPRGEESDHCADIETNCRYRRRNLFQPKSSTM